MKNLTYRLYQQPQTIFTSRDIAIVLGETNIDILKSRINYYVKRGELIALRRGIYARDERYNKYELATKVYTPSYVSLETVLLIEGVIFQFSETITVVSYVTREIEIDGKGIMFRKIKDSILGNPMGIKYEDNFAKASKERAFLDSIYLYKNYYFDNLDGVDWKECESLLSVYEGAITKEKLKSYVNNK